MKAFKEVTRVTKASASPAGRSERSKVAHLVFVWTDHQGNSDESRVNTLLARFRMESEDSDDWDYIRQDEINNKDDEDAEDNEDLGIELDEEENAKLLLF